MLHFAPMPDRIFLEGLEAQCRIGIFDWERKIRQKIAVDLDFSADVRKAARRDRIRDALDYKRVAKFTLAFLAASEFYLIETLAEKLAQALLKEFRLKQVRLRLSKPGAVRHARNVGVEIVRRGK